MLNEEWASGLWLLAASSQSVIADLIRNLLNKASASSQQTVSNL